MTPEKLNEIVKKVVKDVVGSDSSDNLEQYENFYDEMIAQQVTDLLLRPKPYNKESFDISY